MFCGLIFLLGVCCLGQIVFAGYTLEDDYGSDASFFDNFEFFAEADPTRGFVHYVDKATASQNGLIGTSQGSVYIGVENKNIADSGGRQSVRITSLKGYNHGLVILDLAHMPGNICGTWPALHVTSFIEPSWMIGTTQPTAGEIDIIEGINDGPNNIVTLHTNDDGCSVDSAGFTGSLDRNNCYIYSTGLAGNGGCDIYDTQGASYGDGFNAAGGGVFATEWTSEFIQVWRFPSGGIPSDIASGNPNPDGWGTPVARFSGDCDIDDQFQNLHLVFDITFCGTWAGTDWASSSTCRGKAATCVEYVQKDPSAFKESFWNIKSLKVFRK